METIKIRNVLIADTEALLEIYAYYVESTAITFEYDVPSLEEFQNRIENISKKYPYLVLLQENEIIGYAYAGAFVGRAAYARSVELTIYLRKDVRGCGYGRILYETLEKKLKEQGYLNLYACIGYPVEEDQYLTKNSAEFHEHLGFKKAGEFYKCGYKFGTWYNMIWMEKIIGNHW